MSQELKEIVIDGVEYVLTPKNESKAEPEQTSNGLWVPKEGEEYWIVLSDGKILKETYDSSGYLTYISIGNCFKTKKQAEQVAKRIRNQFKLLNFIINQQGELGGEFQVYKDDNNKFDYVIEENPEPDAIFMTKPTAEALCEALNNCSLVLED